MALIRLNGVEKVFDPATGLYHLGRVAGDGTITDLGVINMAAELQVGDVEIGAVEIKDGATDTRAKVGAPAGIGSSDNAMAVADPLTVLAGPDEITVDNTATGKTLATLLGSALEAGLRNLVLVVQGTISWAAGNATAGVNDLDPGVYSIPCTKAMADTFKFIASANTAVSVIQEG